MQNVGIAITSLIVGFLPVTITLIGSRDPKAVPLKKLAFSLAMSALGSVCIGVQALEGANQDADGKQMLGLVCALGHSLLGLPLLSATRAASRSSSRCRRSTGTYSYGRAVPPALAAGMILFESLCALVYGLLWEQRLPTLLELGALTCVVLSVVTCLAAHRTPHEAPARLV